MPLARAGTSFAARTLSARSAMPAPSTSVAATEAKIAECAARDWPFLVCTQGPTVIGYAYAVQFRDIRKDPLSEAEIGEIVAEFGGLLVNRQSTTYRGFSDFLRESEPEAQIAAQPTVMKRPVIRAEKWHLGWDADVQAALL